jgi:hypothetical protein
MTSAQKRKAKRERAKAAVAAFATAVAACEMVLNDPELESDEPVVEPHKADDSVKETASAMHQDQEPLADATASAAPVLPDAALTSAQEETQTPNAAPEAVADAEPAPIPAGAHSPAQVAHASPPQSSSAPAQDAPTFSSPEASTAAPVSTPEQTPKPALLPLPAPAASPVPTPKALTFSDYDDQIASGKKFMSIQVPVRCVFALHFCSACCCALSERLYSLLCV